MKFLLLAVISSALSFRALQASSCGRQSCHGDVGNLAVGREVFVSSTCGVSDGGSSIFCNYGEDDCSTRECSPCVNGVLDLSHPGSHIADSPFSKRKTYWQSKIVTSDEEIVTVRFNLETAFYFTHLVMVFRTPRPGAMILERSVDFGKTWQAYQHYARNCSATFGMNDDDAIPDARCTTRYSDPQPCTKGEVIYRVLNPVNPIDDPYSADSRHLLKVTNLRVQMWQPQYCLECLRADDELTPFRHFAVYDLIVRGTCFCNGHADSCVPLETAEFEPHESKRAVVHGKCICEHNTDGDHCEKCLPLYNDAPWRAGNGYTGEANPCKKCNCHGHAASCHFDRGTWDMTEHISGGVCDGCTHNTEGRSCERCKDHYFRREDAFPADPDVCQECDCHKIGTLSASSDEKISDVDVTKTRIPAPCDSVTGQCHCREGVTGRRCDRCQKGFWGLGDKGCEKCLCSLSICDQVSGECLPDYGDDDDDFFIPQIYPAVTSRRKSNFDISVPRYPEFQPFVARYPQYPKERMAASWRRPGLCICKEKELESVPAFCKMKYDYAIKVRVLGAEDDGTTTVISVAVKRIIKQTKVKIRKGKMFMYPESWTVMGCTCPALLPRSDYIVVGHEDPVSRRLMVNTNSFVKRWSHTKNWARIVHRVLRTKCI